jgi:hypothetical protein
MRERRKKERKRGRSCSLLAYLCPFFVRRKATGFFCRAAAAESKQMQLKKRRKAGSGFVDGKSFFTRVDA